MDFFTILCAVFVGMLVGASIHAWTARLRKPSAPTMKQQIEAELDSILAAAINAGREKAVAQARALQQQSLYDTLNNHHKQVTAIYESRKPRA